jgi:hypothetical protein
MVHLLEYAIRMGVKPENSIGHLPCPATQSPQARIKIFNIIIIL